MAKFQKKVDIEAAAVAQAEEDNFSLQEQLREDYLRNKFKARGERMPEINPPLFTKVDTAVVVDTKTEEEGEE